MVVSDGNIGAIADKDIYKGTFPISELKNAVAVNSYSAMPEEGFDYSFSSTITTPGQPGTPDEIVTTSVSYNVDINNLGYLPSSDSMYIMGIKIRDSYALSLSLSVTDRYGESIPFKWRLRANNTIVKYGDGSSGSSSLSDSAEQNVDWTIEWGKNGDYRGDGNALSFKAVGTRNKYVKTLIPGEPEVPPVYTTTGMPLSPGSGGTYQGMSCLAVRGAYEAQSDMTGYREQVRCFVRNGIEVKNLATGAIESSNNFIDLAYYLLKKNQVSDELIDLQGFLDAREFLVATGLTYNGTLTAGVNLRAFFEAAAPGMLLKFVQNAGKFSFKPVLPIDSNNVLDVGTISPVKVFNNNNIVAGSFALQFYESKLRKRFCALVSWREQFSQQYSRVVQEEIRYAGTAIDGPYESYDYSEFITDTEHASLVGRYALSSRGRIKHQIKFSTYLDVANETGIATGQLAPMDIIRVTVNGTTQRGEVEQGNLYQVDSIAENPDGGLDIEAVHFPTDEAGASLIVGDMFSEDLPNPAVIGAVQIEAFNVAFLEGETITLTAVNEGGVEGLVYSWSGPAGTNAPVNTETSNVLTWTAGGTEDVGVYTVTVTSAMAPDSPRTAERELVYSPYLSAVGGTVTEDGDYKIHTFTTSDTFEITRNPLGTELEYLVCASGGNGVSTSTGFGGGGGGGVLTGTTTAAGVGVYQITVGLPRESGVSKNSSHNSTAFGVTALAGGDAGSIEQSRADGGCGAGDLPDVPNYSKYVRGFGSQGGNGGFGTFGEGTYQVSGGGGGGASGDKGGNGRENRGGNGGEGITSSISGAPYVYGSGGAGGIRWNDDVSSGKGGTGAGRGGRSYYDNGYKQVDNTPPTNYGAGGSSFGPNNAGYQGVVIIRYQFK